MAGIEFLLEKPLFVKYKGVKIDCGYRIDLMVGNSLTVELKSIDKLSNIHQAQILTYMKSSEVGIGLLINFNELRLNDGINRFVI